MLTHIGTEREIMERGINFRSEESQIEYFDAYEKTMQLFPVRVEDEYVDTEFGKSYVIKCGNVENPPLVLLHAASCGSPIWYKNYPSDNAKTWEVKRRGKH